MLMIEIYGRVSDRRTKLGTLRLEDGSCSDPTSTTPPCGFLTRFPVWVRGKEPPLTIEDGEPWLRELPRHLRGTYTWAEESG